MPSSTTRLSTSTECDGRQARRTTAWGTAGESPVPDTSAAGPSAASAPVPAFPAPSRSAGTSPYRAPGRR
ncbi:hypothetical protein [Streptomyces sp. f51]|uniref:hypothetical protein n=1 Tax=Streptomyces sp. f51 TaxID=1827742 RepID=UPI0027B9761C|nr:hypothetical protein [Streptomyces sp. f51]